MPAIDTIVVRRPPAADLATEVLGTTGTRLAHSRRVAEQAQRVCGLLDEPWRSALPEAAWLHDIGYAEDLATTGFHPLDGARWLRDRGYGREICSLVAWHTMAGTEAGLRRLQEVLRAEFPPPPPFAQAALTWADLTSSPAGEGCEVESRLVDIFARYEPDSFAYRATMANLSELRSTAACIEDLLLFREDESL